MTADELALIAAVIAAPDDDMPRLVYADFLEERGDADRATFVRVQCDHARRIANSEPVPPDLVRTMKELRAAAEATDYWLAPAGGQLPFRRGFVETVRVAGVSGAAVTLALHRCSPLREVVFEFTYNDIVPDEDQSARLLRALEAPDNPPYYTPDPRATAGVTQLAIVCSPECPADRVIEVLARQCGAVRPHLILNLWNCPLHPGGANWLYESVEFNQLKAVLLNAQLCQALPPTLVRRLRNKFGDRLVL